MKTRTTSLLVLGATAALAAVALLAGSARAHCDGMDGPVVQAARKALDTGDVERALAWVKAEDEPAIRAAFRETLAVRGLSPQSKELAERYFFETLVRLHRAAEGVAYTGLKPAGRDLGPAIPAADAALESGDVEALVQLVTDSAARGIRERFRRVRALRDHDPRDVRAGREYVEAYVSFVHHAAGCYEAAVAPAPGHVPEDGKHAAHR